MGSAQAKEIRHLLIEPGTPIQNAFIAGFNGKLRECLNERWFEALQQTFNDCRLASRLRRDAAAQQPRPHSTRVLRGAASPTRRRCCSKDKRQTPTLQLILQPGFPPIDWYGYRRQVRRDLANTSAFLMPTLAFGASVNLAIEEKSTMPKPFYLIAHKVNTVDGIETAVRRGVNALECDIRFSRGRGFFVSHNAPDFGPVSLTTYLSALLAETRRSTRLCLVVFDCKPSVSESPGLAVPLLTVIRSILGSPPVVTVLLSTASYDHRAFLGALAGRLGAFEGVAIDEHDNASQVARYFQSVGIQRHAYGNGTLSLGVEVRTASSILDGIALKHHSWGPHFVYVWTLNRKDAIRNYLRLGVDGVFVNFTGALSRGLGNTLDLLRDSEFRNRLRVAVRAYDPFAAPRSPSYLLAVETDSRSDAGTDADLHFRLVGTRGSLTKTISAKPRGLFEAGDRNVVTLEGADVGPLDSLAVSRNTAGNAPGWFLKAITVSSLNLARSHRFNFDTWIPRRGATRWVGQNDYRFVVKTSDVSFAGTDATVQFLLEGDRGRLTYEYPGDVGQRLERDQINQFTVQGPDLGTLRRLTVSHDEAGSASDWHLQWVRVNSAGVSRLFEFDLWVSRSPRSRRAQ